MSDDFSTDIPDLDLTEFAEAEEKAEKAENVLTEIAQRGGITVDQINQIEEIVPGVVFDNYPEGGYSEVPRQEGTEIVMESLTTTVMWAGGAVLVTILLWIAKHFLNKGSSGSSGSPFSSGTKSQNVKEIINHQDTAATFVEERMDETLKDLVSGNVVIPKEVETHLIAHVNQDDLDRERKEREHFLQKTSELVERVDDALVTDKLKDIWKHQKKITPREIWQEFAKYGVEKTPMLVLTFPANRSAAIGAMYRHVLEAIPYGLNDRWQKLQWLYKNRHDRDVSGDRIIDEEDFRGLGADTDAMFDLISDIRLVNVNKNSSGREISKAFYETTEQLFKNADAQDQRFHRLVTESIDADRGWHRSVSSLLHGFSDIPAAIEILAEGVGKEAKMYQEMVDKLELETSPDVVRGEEEARKHVEYLRVMKALLNEQKAVVEEVAKVYNALMNCLKRIHATRDEVIMKQAHLVDRLGELVDHVGQSKKKGVETVVRGTSKKTRQILDGDKK